MLDAGIGRPGHFAGILAQMRENAGTLAEKAMQAAFIRLLVIAAVQDAEIAASDGLFH